ncbi:RHO GTPASE-ACTIVATING GACO-LIKE PROTEIN [Salix purpurea]|uniref:RHO GTPASE-ACTIVATING GACO-LIKE PROTEIN n=1 Tax=Salix purpurea TaxID=77065 RepID=A0A9Q0YXB9_SALPP|nr:RHO GTPASE-ACTIVATING GACO-LIKE PROTEIN [Salix purpurea]
MGRGRDEEVDNGKTGITSKETKSPAAAENGKKRKRYSQAKEKPESVKEENGVGTRSSTDDSTKSNGFRHNGSRRKNKPRRAAEAGVEFAEVVRVPEDEAGEDIFTEQAYNGLDPRRLAPVRLVSFLKIHLVLLHSA